jgi:hypothetical protein
MENYKIKYLKYKNKYINLKKKLIGGIGVDDIPKQLYPFIHEHKKELTEEDKLTKIFLEESGYSEEEIEKTFHIMSKDQYKEKINQVFITDILDITEIMDVEPEHNKLRIIFGEENDEKISFLRQTSFLPILESFEAMKTKYPDKNMILKVINARGDGKCFYNAIYMYLWLSRPNDMFSSMSIDHMEDYSFEIFFRYIIESSLETIKKKFIGDDKKIKKITSQITDPNTPSTEYSIEPISTDHNLNILIIQIKPFTNPSLTVCRSKTQNEYTGNVILLQLSDIHYKLLYLYTPKELRGTIIENNQVEHEFFNLIIDNYRISGYGEYIVEI